MTTHAHAQATGETAAAPARTLQRACACGESAGVSGKCPECEAEERLGEQPKLRINRPGDRWEQEADRIADEIVSARPAPAHGPLSITPLLQRQAAEHEEELRAKPAPGAMTAHRPAAAGAAAEAVAQGGRPLAPSQRAFYEPRLGRDLSAVRIHDDPRAGAAARRIGARAYTLGPHIAFAPGQFAPGTGGGRRLLAHELVHTLQQGGEREIRRTCPSDPADIPAGTEEDFERRADEALAHESYRALDRGDRRIVRHIIDGARASECPMYYVEQLHLLFNTPESPDAEQAAEAREGTSEAVEAEEERLEDPNAVAASTRQEDIASDPSRRWTTRRGEGGVRYRVDRTDPTNAVVRLKVRLRPRGEGTREDVARTEALEDAIEIAGSSRGYTLDLVFVRRGGSDVFTVGVDPSEWTTSGNWVGDPQEIAHEAHHLLGLEDRYNYIEAHAANPDMDMDDRLYWFREQMVRAADPLAHTSMMERHDVGTINDEDVCAVAGGDFEACLVARFESLPIGEIERRARALNRPYRAQHAAMIRLLMRAWESKDYDEIIGACANERDPLCGLPPMDAFGDSNITAGDASRFPLANPHRQPRGRTLTRERRSP